MTWPQPEQPEQPEPHPMLYETGMALHPQRRVPHAQLDPQEQPAVAQQLVMDPHPQLLPHDVPVLQVLHPLLHSVLQTLHPLLHPVLQVLHPLLQLL